MSDPATRAAAFLEEAVSLSRRASLEEALVSFRKAEAAYEKLGQTEGVAEVLIEQGRAMASSFRHAEVRDATHALDRAESLLADGDAEGLRARLWHVRGYAELRAGRVNEAIGSLRSAEKAFRALGDRRGEARVLDTLGVLYERTADRERAALLLAHSHALKQAAGDREGVAISLGNLGRLALHGGNAHEAEAFFRLDLELARDLDDARGAGVVLTNLSEALVAAGQAQEARAFAEEAIEVALGLESPVSEGFARVALADALRASGEVEAAIDAAATAEACFQRAGMAIGIAAARLARGRAEARAGRFRQAAAHALRAARGARHAGQVESAIEAFLEANQWLLDISEPQRARSALQRAQDLAAQSGLPELADRVRQRVVGEAVSLAGRRAELVVELELAAGRLVGREGARLRLRVDAFLGEGAFATVLRVVDTSSGEMYALKRLHATRDRMTHLTQRMEREFRALARVDEEARVVRVHGIGHVGGQPCLLLDCIGSNSRHATLDDLLEDMGRLPPLLAISLARDAATGLAALHAGGVVHRDVKPGNLLLDSEGRGVLTDCGLAYDMEEEAYIPESNFAGSLAYAAPELLVPGSDDWTPPTPEADVYSLGVMLFRQLTGAWPFPMEGSLRDVIVAKLEHPPLLDRLPPAAAELRSVLQTMLVTEPEYRPAAATVAVALDYVLRGSCGV